jgi:hypothetical protein
MATIITHPDILSFSQNLRKIEVASSTEVRFRLFAGATAIIDENYYPNSQGRVVIDVRDIISSYLSCSIPTSNIFQQTSIIKQFSIVVNELAAVDFSVIRGGVENLSETASNFLLSNWLTWQPQVKNISYYQPEWLTYYAPAAAVVRVKFYLQDDSTAVITLHSPAAGTCYSYNMQFAYIMSLAVGEKYGYFDVWVENASAVRVSYIQRYVYREQNSTDEFFVFENSLGGVDTAVMSGESSFEPEIEHKEGIYENESVQINSPVKRYFEKNTGWKSKAEADWLFDFFNSRNKYKVLSGEFRKITLNESNITDLTSEDMKSFSFRYKLSQDLGLLNISRSMDAPPANLEITTPGSLFFLAPRLIEFPSADLEDTMLFPVQSPFSEVWKKISWGAIWNFLYDKLIASALGVMAHVHDNFSILGELSEDGGKLKYKGEEISPSGGFGVKLGETSQTAYRGDRGKIAYDHTLNSAPHFSSPAQKLKLTEIANDYHVLADPAVEGLLIQTLIPTSVASDYINISISGFGKIDAGPFAWSGQIYYTSGNFASAAIKSVGRGETLDVRIFIRDGFIGLWVNGKVKSILNFFNVKISICYGDELTNLIDTIIDAPYPASGLTAEIAFKDYPETFLRGIPAADQLRIDRAVIATDTTQYKIWVGTAPDYAAISPKDPNTFYYIT